MRTEDVVAWRGEEGEERERGRERRETVLQRETETEKGREEGRCNELDG